MIVHGASFLITFRCPSMCEHCAYNAGPEQVGHIDLNDAERWLTELVETPRFEWLTLHGGEPFLYMDEMKEILRMAKELDIPKRGAITNSYWAETPQIARETLKSLSDSGLNRITFSVDGFHQQYIDINNVKFGIEAAISVGIDKVWVDSYYLESLDSQNMYDRLTKSTLGAVKGINGVEYSMYQVDFEGRGARSLPRYAPMSSMIPSGKCVLPYWLGGDLRNPEVIEIDFEGNITLCPGLCIGNANTNSLSKILTRYTLTEHPIVRILAEEGPIGLHKLAKQLGLQPDLNFVNECHLCFEMRKLLHDHYPDSLSPRICYQ